MNRSKPPHSGEDKPVYRRRPKAVAETKPRDDRPPRRDAKRSSASESSSYHRRPQSPSARKPKDGWIKPKNVWRNSTNKDRSEKRVPSSRAKVQTNSEHEQLVASATSKRGPGDYEKFGDIPAHKLGRALRSRLYKVAGSLSAEESNNLASRLKYAATTVTAALATGFGEGSFRTGVSRTLESRGALLAIQDHLQQMADTEMLDQEKTAELVSEVDKVIAAVNDYLGRLVKKSKAETGTKH